MDAQITAMLWAVGGFGLIVLAVIFAMVLDHFDRQDQRKHEALEALRAIYDDRKTSFVDPDYMLHLHQAQSSRV